MKTAVTQLIEYMEANFYITDESRAKFEQAKAMEREQIEDAYGDGLNAHRTNFCDREQYYNQTYKGGEQ